MVLSCSTGHVMAPVYKGHSAVNKNATSYKVRAGDTLYSIAWQSGHDYKDIARWNGIAKPYTIYAAQVISLKPRKKAYLSGKKSQVKESKTLKKQKVTKTSSNKINKGLKLVWQWPIEFVSLEKGTIKTGVVLRAKAGGLVRSSEHGKVVYAGNGLKGYGNLVIVLHKNDFLTAYGYNKRLLVREGSYVKKGQAIAEIGRDSMNRYVLFFELRQHGKAVSVVKYFPRYRG